MAQPEVTRKKTLFRQRMGGREKLLSLQYKELALIKKRTVIRNKGVDKRRD